MTDQYGCLDSLSQSLTQPTALTFRIGRLDSISCHNTDDGEVQVIAGGGTPPYRYSIDGINYQSGATFSNLTPGSYTVTLRDTNDCQETVQFTLFNPLAISPTISGLDMVSCNGFTDGFIQVAPLNGFPPFTYSLDGISYQGGGSFSNLGANTYTIRIKDRKGCEESINIVVTEPTPLDLNLSATDVTCYGFNDGTIIATANGGTPPYIYRLNAGPWISNNNYIGLGPNSAHQVVVEDDNGCQTVKTITIIEPAPLVGTAQTTDVTCWGGQDGTITISAAGGISPYIYEYSPDGVNWYNNFDGFFDNLAGGDYDLRIRDDNRCIYDFDAVITEPLRTIVNFDFDSVSCYGYSDGMIHLSALSPNDPDKAPFTFSITGDNFSLNPDIGGLAAGTHTVYSRDQDGCIDSVQFYMPQPPQQVVTLSPNPMTLELGNSMQVGLMLNGRPDMNQVTYQWVPGYFISCTDCPEPYINTPFSGNYKVRVIENNYGCKAEATIEVIVLEPDPIFVPNIFTPNGDGWNDFVYVFGNDLEQIEFQIYDRWGEKVFETVDQSFGWDGTFKGVDARPGVYTWVLDGLYINGQRIQEAGTVTLYR
jgi:gliding motility-associated-like protein